MELLVPRGVVFDGRIEIWEKTIVICSKNGIEDYRTRQESGGFFRVEKEGVQYATCVSGIEACQAAIEKLVNQVEGTWDSNQCQTIQFEGLVEAACDMTLNPWLESLQMQLKTFPELEQFNLYVHLSWSSKGLIHQSRQVYYYEKNMCGLHLQLSWLINGKLHEDSMVISAPTLESLISETNHMDSALTHSYNYSAHKENITPGRYPVVLSPQSTGMFIHECFGHLREADFEGNGTQDIQQAVSPEPIIKSETPQVFDDGRLAGWGYTPIDDEGVVATGVLLFKEGVLQGKMHSQATAKRAGLNSTGNARAIDFTYEPIVRMTNTYLTAGEESLEALLQRAEGGIYIEHILEGNGQSLFSLSPGRCWRIRNGKLAEPVGVNLVTGSIDEALGSIRGRSQDFSLHGMVKGGCGKLDQFPLEVGFGGPYTFIEGMVLR